MTLRPKYDEIKKVIIYEILCLTTGERYIGSTTNFLKRKSLHKKNNNDCESKNIIKNNNYKFNILEEFNCNYKLSKALKEQYYLDNLENINKNRALQLSHIKKKYDRDYKKNYNKKWYIKNKNKIKLYTKKYEEENKEKIKEKKCKKYKCDCGTILSKNNKSRHNKTKKHLDYLRKNTI